MEAQRDLTQIIVHVDMDAFYANVEILDDPSLKGTIFAVSRPCFLSGILISCPLGRWWGPNYRII